MKNRAIRTATIAIIASVFLIGKVAARESLPGTFYVNFYLGTVYGFSEYFKLKNNTSFQGRRYDGMVFPDGLGTLPRTGRIERF